ncbi:MAG: hypothetical protein MJ120_02405 [Clostridia bacterium]|nr:hypothetical protein [Clostridia bacterium]
MIDIHTHILPEIDDGAKDLEESLRLCLLGRNHHIKKTVVTPHFSSMGDVDHFIEKRDEKVRILKKNLELNGIEMEIFAGAEVYVNDDVFFAQNLRRLTINNSRYLLVEFDFSGKRLRDIFDYLNELYSMGIVPIIAHPERYEYFQHNYDAVNELVSRGVLFQINAGSLASRDGREAFELSYEMAYKGAAAFIATDAHSLHRRPNDIGEMLRVFPQDIDGERMFKMLERNGEFVLNNQVVPRRTSYPRLEKRRVY